MYQIEYKFIKLIVKKQLKAFNFSEKLRREVNDQDIQ